MKEKNLFRSALEAYKRGYQKEIKVHIGCAELDLQHKICANLGLHNLHVLSESFSLNWLV